MRRTPAAATALAATLVATQAAAGPETSLADIGRAIAMDGVRAIGLGGDGATIANVSLAYRDAAVASIDHGVTRFTDTGTVARATAVTFTTPTFWNGAALSIVGLAQQTSDARVNTTHAFGPDRDPALGDGSSQSLFVKLSKRVTETVGVGVALPFEASQMTLLPNAGTQPVRYETQYRPSVGVGVHWLVHPGVLLGARALFDHAEESRDSAAGLRSGLFRTYETRLGATFSPWLGTIVDLGGVRLDRWSELDPREDRHEFYATMGLEQALVKRRVWIRAGVDETTWTLGLGVRAGPVKLDVAYLHGVAAARIGDVFGHESTSLFAKLSFDYARLIARPARDR